MAIVYPLTLPTTRGASRARISAKNVVAVSMSPFTLSQQVQKHPGAAWEVEVDLASMSRAEAEVWSSFLLKLGGRYGTFLMGDPNAEIPRGAAAMSPGTPLVRGTGQTGQEIIFDGAPTSVTGYFLAGDYLQIGSGSSTRLHKVLEDCDSDADGIVSATIWPALRASPADNAAIIVSAAKGIWRLNDNTIAWEERPGDRYGLSFSASEAI
ncbi:MAG: hypothetical protein E6R03_01215 [Hyphomicrobiaceae bacterium]|nr:MAG: hypothetical protein E6R03_01215 [Hyphomicrobiaceae bacterium]